MLVGILNSIHKEHAKFVRDVSYVREMAIDDEIDDRFHKVDVLYSCDDSENEYKEAAEMLEHVSDSFDFEEQEIERLMEASDNCINMDAMMGINE